MSAKILSQTFVLAGVTLWQGLFCLAQTTSDYKIAASDVLVIDLVGEKDLPHEFKVSGNGTISYPFLEPVTVAGKTTTEIKDILTRMLDKDYFVNPQIVVDVKEYRVREVVVNGQVNKPGSVSLPGEVKITILEAIGRAGGFTPRANTSKIKFSRPGQPERIFKYDDLKNETNVDKVITLQPGDVIEVVDKFF